MRCKLVILCVGTCCSQMKARYAAIYQFSLVEYREPCNLPFMYSANTVCTQVCEHKLIPVHRLSSMRACSRCRRLCRCTFAHSSKILEAQWPRTKILPLLLPKKGGLSHAPLSYPRRNRRTGALHASELSAGHTSQHPLMLAVCYRLGAHTPVRG
jgi:hypothetical protein